MAAEWLTYVFFFHRSSLDFKDKGTFSSREPKRDLAGEEALKGPNPDSER